jgi:tryptophanyl-tRNA synthetase
MKGRIFSGMRPSGRLHIGNYLGALQNWVSLQKEYECIYCAVDIHALTDTSGKATAQIQSNIRDMILDWLAAGIDPQQSIVFVQSHVPEVMTLHTLLSMTTPLGWLLRVPTFKEKVRHLDTTEANVSYGLVGYPVLQTADIILYKADTVPVGEDQVPHLELAREIVRRFNNLYGDTFPEPQAKLTQDPLIVGLDGKNKMSKTLNNQIELAATEEETSSRVMTAVTDPQRRRRSDPGRPWLCNVYNLQKVFNPEKKDEIYQACTTASIGCVEDKQMLTEGINSALKSFRERRRELKANPEHVDKALRDGAERARAIARQTLAEVYERMGLGKP